MGWKAAGMAICSSSKEWCFGGSEQRQVAVEGVAGI